MGLPSGLFKVRGYVSGHAATLLIDSGASAEFIDPAFAARCGLSLDRSERTVKLADGSVVAAQGCVTAIVELEAARGEPIPFTATYTATPLAGYDAILGVSWLAQHDPRIGWANRSITVRAGKNRVPRLIKPLECLTPERAPRLATLTCSGLSKAIRRREVDEVFALFIRPSDGDGVPTARTVPLGPGLAVPEGTDPAMAALLAEFADCFPDKVPAGLPPARGVEHRIELKPGARPPPCRPLRKQSPRDLAVFEEYTRQLVADGHARVSHSPYGAMALIARKKDGSPRVVVDYRGLNELTVKNKYPLPLMEELFDRVHGAKYFTSIDLRNGFHQIRIAPEDVEKTAFRTRYGSFEYLVLPMGLCNSPSTFMQLMNDTFRDVLDKFVLCFLDDILVFSRTRDEHLLHVREVLTRLRRQKLYAKLSKCEFMKPQVEFLGHRIGADGLSVSQDKVAAVRDWPAPRDVRDVRSFLGLANFYRKFVKDFAKIASPLTNLTKTTVAWAWGGAQQDAFDGLKRALCAAPVLLIPDPSKQYVLNCDACDYAVGGTLQQDQGSGLQPVAYWSHALSGAELNYDVREKEFLALKDACLHWRHYLHSDLPFRLLSDHESIKYHKTMPNLSGRLARWVQAMAEFDYTIEHIPGVQNVVADALSRRADFRPAATQAQPPQQLAAARVRPPRRRAPHVRVHEDPDDAIVPPVFHPDPEVQRGINRAAAEGTRPPAPGRPAPNRAGAIVMPSQRCTATTKAGAHCRQRTAKGQYC